MNKRERHATLKQNMDCSNLSLDSNLLEWKTDRNRVGNCGEFTLLLAWSNTEQHHSQGKTRQSKCHRFSNALGATARTTARLVMIRPADKTATTTMLPLLAGNLPLMT